MDWAWGQKSVEFLTGLTGNPVLNKNAKITIESAQKEFNSTGKPVKRGAQGYWILQRNHENNPIEINKGCGTCQNTEIKRKIELPVGFYGKCAFEKSLWIFQELRI